MAMSTRQMQRLRWTMADILGKVSDIPPAEQFSEGLGIPLTLAQRWLKTFREKGIKALRTPYRRPGKSSFLTEAQQQEVQAWLKTPPGFESLAGLTDAIEQRFGVRYSHANTGWLLTKKWRHHLLREPSPAQSIQSIRFSLLNN